MPLTLKIRPSLLFYMLVPHPVKESAYIRKWTLSYFHQKKEQRILIIIVLHLTSEKNYVFQVKKLLTCLDSFVLRWKDFLSNAPTQLTHSRGMSIFPIHRVHSSLFFVYDQLLQQQRTVFTKLFNCIVFFHKALDHRWWTVHSISSPVLSLVWHVGLTHIRPIHYRTDIVVVVVKNSSHTLKNTICVIMWKVPQIKHF